MTLIFPDFYLFIPDVFIPGLPHFFKLKLLWLSLLILHLQLKAWPQSTQNMPLCYKITFICQYSSDGLVVHKFEKYFYRLQLQNPHKAGGALNMLVGWMDGYVYVLMGGDE